MVEFPARFANGHRPLSLAFNLLEAPADKYGLLLSCDTREKGPTVAGKFLVMMSLVGCAVATACGTSPSIPASNGLMAAAGPGEGGVVFAHSMAKLGNNSVVAFVGDTPRTAVKASIWNYVWSE